VSKEESGYTVLWCSDEVFRMYNLLCAGSREEHEDTKSKKSKQKEFSSRTPAFFLAAAIGIMNDRVGIVKGEKQLTRREYIVNHANFAPFAQLLKTKFNLKTDQEILNKLQEFQEVGIRELYDEYHKTGRINFLRIFRDAKARL
jgi:hypothetical protein